MGWAGGVHRAHTKSPADGLKDQNLLEFGVQSLRCTSVPGEKGERLWL